jgi:hypothetical protein
VTDTFVAAPQPSYRLIPSKFPPIAVFDTVATAADLPAVLDLVGWTNDRLVRERVARLPETEWVFGRPNASIVMGAFLHVVPGGMRFNGPDLGGWYAADDIRTAAAEVGHHLRREAFARSVQGMRRQYRTYKATLLGDYVDIRGRHAGHAALYAHDNYAAAQAYGETVRAGGGGAGILYDSLRRLGGTNAVVYRPRNIVDIIQTDHFEISVTVDMRTIDVRRLS